MNKPQNPHTTFLQFMLRVQHLARHDARSDKGYAMLMTSVISIAMLSMLAAYMTMTNLSRSSTNAYVDGTNTFYAAESGLNRRAQQVRERFVGYAAPTGTAPGSNAAGISNCFPIARDLAETVNDLECRNYGLTYNNNIAATRDGAGNTVIGEQNDNREGVNYIAYTFVADKTNYPTTGSRQPATTTVPSGQTYSGLKMQEYKYTIFATANANQNIASGITPGEMAAKGRKQAYDAAVAAAAKAAADALAAGLAAPTTPAPTPPPAADAALVSSHDSKRSTADTANASRAAANNRMNTVLQMDFKSRIVPLFQFAAFYEGDLEVTSSSNMTLAGRVHTNANLYLQPSTATAGIATSFLSSITTVGSIYNRVDATWGGGTLTGISRVLMTGAAGADCTTGTCVDFTLNSTARTIQSDPFTNPQLSGLFGAKVKAGNGDASSEVKRLNTPPPGFLRKRNYYQGWTGNTTTTQNNSGEYYSKADMRLEMVPDRDVSSTAASPWTRNQAVIPFNFTSITSVAGAANTCTTTLPAKDAATGGVPTLANDPAANYIDPDRNNPGATGTLLTNLHCNQFTKGQLQSLRQPVMVLTDINQPTNTLRTAIGATPVAGSEARILGRPSTLTPLASLVGASTATKTAILRALQVAIVSTPLPVRYDGLATTTVNASAFSVMFSTLIDSAHIPALTDTDRDNLKAATPNAIAALGNAWFLPAPIQRIESTALLDTAVRNTRSSGFYDGREQRWMTILQTNIASLSLWNRDGLYVEASDNATDTLRRSAYATTDTLRDVAFNSGTGANSTDGLAFDRTPVASIPGTITAKGLQTLGLGSIDSTEGGLVLHATVSDDLDGDDVMSAANDVSLDTSNPIMKRDAVGDLVGADNKKPITTANPSVTIDYPRKYRNATTIAVGPEARSASPFGFAFNGGDYLPGALTLVTDQPIYVQGDFNNNGFSQVPIAPSTTSLPDSNRLPASIIGDVITVLSNQCLATSSTATAAATLPELPNHLGVPASQLRCGLPRAATGSVNANTIVGGLASDGASYPVTGPTAVNAAFLSNTDRAIGNLGTGRGWASNRAGARSSGSLNNYMRMLENWGGETGQFLNYSGSFVSLGTPIESSGRYFNGAISFSQGYYVIPQRNFGFDSNFETFTSLPPLPPRAIYLQQDVFKRNY